MLDLLGAVGGQIGEFLEAWRSAAALREAEARKSAMLEAALDFVVTIDHHGHVVELNPAAEEMFGYPREEALGREMAELIVPPDLRDAHRKALARCVDTGEGTLLGKRLELRAMRRDGTEFPIELTITRIGEADPPMFTGFMRDITRRQAYEEERERLLGARAGRARGRRPVARPARRDPQRRGRRRDRPGARRQPAVRERLRGRDARLRPRWRICSRRPSPR